MNEETKKTKDSHYVTTVRSEKCPAIAATIFRAVKSDGEVYLYFSISRAWKSKDDAAFSYSNRFFPRHAEGISEASDLAAKWIEANPQAMAPENGPNSQSPTESPPEFPTH